MDAFLLVIYLGMKKVCIVFIFNAQEYSVWTYKIGVFGVAQKDIYPVLSSNTSKFNFTCGLPSFLYIRTRGHE